MKAFKRSLAALALLLVVLSFWPRSEKSVPTASPTPHKPSAAVSSQVRTGLLSYQAAQHDALAVTTPDPAATPSTAAAPLQLTGTPPTRFAGWVERYFNEAWGGDQAALLEEGERLALERREYLAREIEENPRAALEHAVPYSWRQRLPAQITRHFEEVVSGLANYEVFMASPVPGHEYYKFKCATYRYATVGGRTYRAYVYGARVSQMAHERLPLHGIAIDDALAVHEEPARLLEAEETALIRARGGAPANSGCAVCGQLAADGGRLLDVAGSYVNVCNASDAAALNRALMSLDARKLAAAYSALPVWTNAPPKPPLPSFGPRRALYMRLVFRDDITIPISEQQAASQMEQANAFYIEASYGKTALIPTVTPILTLPHPKVLYSKLGPARLMTDALAEAAKEGYVAENFELVLARFTPVPGFNWGGLGGGKQAWLQYSGVGLIIHEVGHCYGLGHANYWETRRAPLPTPPPDRWDTDSVIGHDSMIGAGDDLEYGDIFDVMGSGGGEYQGGRGPVTNQPISSFAGHFNPVGKSILGWLPESAIAQAADNRTNRIYVFDTPVLVENRAYALKLRKDEQRSYWVSARAKIPGNPWISNGVSLHWGSWPQLIGYSTLIDTTPGTPEGREDSAILVGRTFTDPEINLYITPVAKGGSGLDTYFDVVVNRGPFPGNAAPSVELRVTTNRVAVGRPVTFTVDALDSDGDALAYYWDISDGTLGTNGPTLTRTWTVEGDYRVRVEVSDMRGHVVSRHVVVQVGARTGFRISGTVFDNRGAPLAGARVANGLLTNTTELATNYQATFTDSDGTFTLINELPGDREVTAFKHGYRTTPQNFNRLVTVADQDVTGLEFLAQEQPQVSVRLTTDADLVRGRPGVFTFSRTGDTNTQLRAVFTLGGTAKEGTDFTRLTNTTTHTNTLRTLLTTVNLPVPFYVVDFATGAVTARVTINTATNTTAADDKYLSAAVMYALQKEQVYATNVDDGQGGQTNGFATNYTYLTGWEVINFNNEDTWFQTYGDYAVGSPGEARMTFKAAPATNPVVSILALGKAASENSGDSALFLLTRSGQTNVEVTVRLSFTGTATYGEDYRPLPDLIRIPAGVTSVPLLFYVIPDLYLEGNETVSISILPDSAYRVGSAKADLTIGDNDLPTLTVSATDPVASEVGNDNAAVVLTRIGDLTRDLTVNYLVGGTAVGGRDYRALPGSIVIPAGQPSVTLVIQPRDNRLQDGGNSLEIILSDSPLYNVGVPGVANVFIQDGAFPTVSILALVTNASEPNTFGEFILTRSGDTRGELVVNLAVGGTARPVADYTPITTLGRIPAGAASVTIRVNPMNDSIREDAETVIAEILPGTNYNIGSRQGQVVISDDDSGLLGVGFTFLGTTVSEGARTGLVAVSVSANPNQNEDVTVDWKVTGGTAVPELDYPGTNAGRLVFANVPDPEVNNRVQLIAFPILDDTNAEPDKTIVLTLVEPAPLVSNEVVTNEITLTNAQGETIGTTNVLTTNVIITPIPLNAVLEAYRSHTITLLDDDSSVVSLAVEDAVAMEEGRKRGMVLLRREGSTARDQVVRLAIAGSAGNGSDYVTIPSEVVILSGESELPLPIIPVDDPMQEFLEDVRIAIVAAPGATVLTNQAVGVTIMDNDGTVEFRSPTYTAFESAGRAEIALRRTSDTNGSATVAYQVAAGTATTNDFVPTNGVVSFAPGEVVKSFTVDLLDDRVIEPEKTVRLTLRNLSDGVPLGGQIEATLTLLDDDTIVEFLAPAVQALENDSSAGVIVTRYGIITNQLRVELAATTNGTAVVDQDFVVTNYPVVFQPGQTAVVAQVVLLDDVLFDGDRVVAITLTNLDTAATLGTVTNGAITVLDDECAIELVATNYTVDEYARTLAVAVRRTGSALHAVQVDYNTADRTAQGGRDYVTARDTLRFTGADLLRAQDGTGVKVLQAGETNQTLVLRILDDVLGEGNETFRLNLNNARLTVGAGLPGTVVLGANTNATVLIVDNETPGSVDFEFNPGEGANDTVLALALQADARVVLGGRFTEVDTVALNHIARLHDDGYLDTFFNPGEGFNDTVLALAAQPDGRLLVGGQFTRFNTNALNRIARLNADGAVDPEFRVGAGADAPVRALAVEAAGTILVGGDFNTVGSVARSRLARLQPGGAVDTAFNPRLDGAVHALAVQPDGRILVGGAFATAGGLGRPFLARLDADGSADATFNPGAGPDRAVHGLALQPDGRVLIAGAFRQVAGQPRRGIARLNADGSLDTSFNPGEGANDTVYGVGLAADGKVLIGGAFTQFDGQDRNRFTRLNLDGSLDTVFDIGTGANGTVFTLVVQPNTAMLIGGDFTEVNRLPRNRIARIHGDERFRLNVLQFSAASYRAAENAGEATITVVRAGDLSVPAQVDYHTSDGTAVAGQDYESARGTLRFAAGETVQTFKVRLLDDAFGEGNLTINLQLSNLPPGFSLTARLQAVLTIEDDESAVAFASTAYSVRESEGAAAIVVRRTGPTNTVVSVQYATADGTAVAGRDYDSASGTLSFAAGVTELSFNVTVRDNGEIEPDRTVLLSLTNPQGGAVLGRVNTARLTILDDDSVENYALNITPPIGGTVTPTSGLYPAGSTQTITAVPAQGFRFVGWEGTVVSTTNPLVLVMDRNHVLMAKFQPVAYTYTFEPPFSAADLRQPPWQSVSTQPWQLQSSTASSGRFAVRSGVTADGQDSTLQLTVESRGGPAAFDVRVSSEANWDFAEFYVDGLRLERWTGEVPWRTYLFNLGPGTHTLAWRYVKDNNFAGGLDAMFVDNLYMPLVGPDPTDPAAQLRLVTVPGGLQLWITGKVGLTYAVEAGTDLATWSQLSTHLNTSGTIVVPLTLEPNTPARYYRVVTTP